MSNLQQAAVKTILDVLQSADFTIETFLITAISEGCINHPLSTSFLEGGIETLLDGFLQNNLTHSAVSNWGMIQAVSIYQQQMSNLTYKGSGFHFMTAKMTEEQLRNFDIKDLMERMITIAPDLWKLVEKLHAADSRINYQRTWTQKRSKKAQGVKRKAGRDGDIEMEDVQTAQELEEEEEYWKADSIMLIGEEEDVPEDFEEQTKTQFEALTQIVRWIHVLA
jgi:hypothetical protein